MAQDHHREDDGIATAQSNSAPSTRWQNQSYHSNQSYQTQSYRTHNGIQRPYHPMLNNYLTHNLPSDTSPHHGRPLYSLAGNPNGYLHTTSYVDPRYYDLNPNYQRPKNEPIWGLAKPLPRVVRTGMRRGRGNEGVLEDKAAEIEEPGNAEAIPQVGMIDDQRQDAGKDPKQIPKRPTEERGYGHQREHSKHYSKRQPSARSEHSSIHSGSGQRSFGRYGSPKEEKENPMDTWSSEQQLPDNLDPFDGAGSDIGDRRLHRLSSVEEESLSRHTGASTASIASDVDLEAGEKIDDWSVEDEEAERYLLEERENYNAWASIRARFREPLAECLATMIAVLIGLSTNLAVLTSNDTSGSYQSANWAWGLGVTVGVYIAGGISGAHLNPAISLMLSIFRGFPFRKAAVYICAQIFGAFLAGLIVYRVYKDAIISFNQAGGESGSTNAVGLASGGTGKAFYTQPASFAGPGGAFANEFVATAILSCAILALGDDSNAPPGAGMHALIVGLLVTALTMAFGYTTGACLNPARDFGPRLATLIVGYGGEVFKISNAWWIWGAWGATITGALAGGLAYDIAVFVGGESPVNYPRSKRKRIGRNAKENSKRCWWIFRGVVEKGVKRDFSKEG